MATMCVSKFALTKNNKFGCDLRGTILFRKTSRIGFLLVFFDFDKIRENRDRDIERE